MKIVFIIIEKGTIVKKTKTNQTNSRDIVTIYIKFFKIPEPIY